MYLPIVFGYEIYGGVPVFFGFFHKFIDACLEYNWPIIAQENYFQTLEEVKEKTGYNVYADLERHCVQHKDSSFIEKVDKYIIPDAITKQIVSESGSIDDAWVNIMKDSFSCFEKYLEQTILDIKNKYKKEIKAVLVWRHNESIDSVCKKLGIKVIEMEFSTIRQPFYNDLVSYFQYSDKYSTGEFVSRYNRFVEENNDTLPILTRKEILALFLSKDNINFINKMDDPIVYELGIALGLKKDFESRATGCMSNTDIIQHFKPYYKNNSVVYRTHPGEPYVFKNKVNLDNSFNSADFILKCKRVASVLSNIGYEAMLFGKTSYIMGDMPYASFGANSCLIEEEVVDLKRLNYITFAFFAPYKLMLDKDYLDWRDSNPSESEIYMRHLKYYFENRNIDLSILKERGINRLETILKCMNYKNVKELLNDNPIDYKKELINKDNIISELDNVNAQLKNTINDLSYQLNIKNTEINNIVNSKSWKITKPLRAVRIKLSKRGDN